MSKQHKIYMTELKRVYEASKKSLVGEEGKLKKRVETRQGELKNVETEISHKQNDINSLNQQIPLLETRKEYLSREILKGCDKLDGVKRECNKEREQTRKEVADFAEKRRKAAEIDQQKKTDLEKDKNAAEEAQEKNKVILNNIKSEQGKIDSRNKTLEDKELDFKERQYKFNEKARKDAANNAELWKKVSTVKSDKDWIAQETLRLTNQKNTQDKIKKEQEEKGVKQKDRDTEQDLRDMRLDEKDRRTENLIEIHNLKNGKTI